MPVTTPTLDDRSYQELLDEALARIPVHNPEWTNFNESDPGVTIVQVFAFLTESMLYRANQIPERNRRKFLRLLGVPIRSAASAKGMVTFSNGGVDLETVTLPGDIEVRAGKVPFRTRAGLDVLPIEVAVFYKRPLQNPDPSVVAHYRLLHASFLGTPPEAEPLLYETAPLQPPRNGVPGIPIDLGTDTVDGSLWLALLLRRSDVPQDASQLVDQIAKARAELAGMTLNLGIVPDISRQGAVALPATDPGAGEPVLQYQIPIGGSLTGDRLPRYRSLPARGTSNVLGEPGIVQVDLPMADQLVLWDNLEPLESGVGDFPPALDESALERRVITWLRVRLPAGDVESARARRNRPRIAWACINAAMVDQRVHVAGERLSDGTGEPDQAAFLTQTPVIAGSVELLVSRGVGTPRRRWTETDDLLAASPEGPDDDIVPPHATVPVANPGAHVFTVNSESGEIRFGDGLRGRRPPFGAHLVASYDVGLGREGNVGIGSIKTGATLPAAMQVFNPIPTWGGDAGETVPEGEKQIARFLQHRERLVTSEDFDTITRRTPGVDIGRVEVLPAFNPELSPNEPGDAPGAVTILAIPKFDPYHPREPEPDQVFLNSICAYVAPRRLVTTELHVRGPEYVGVWISVGFEAVPDGSTGEVREAVKQAIRDYLSPLTGGFGRGWPLRKPVVGLELWAVANRVPGVSLVTDVLLAAADGAAVARIDLFGLELPKVLGIEAQPGEPAGIDSLRNRVIPLEPGEKRVAVPVIPEECR
jgi:hypothetical protein